MLYLAIDQHRKQLTVNVRNEKGDAGLLQATTYDSYPHRRP